MSDGVLFLYQVLFKYRYVFRVTDLKRRVDARVVAIYKGYNSLKFVDGIMVPYLCTSSDDALYWYQVSRKYLKGFQSHREDAICILKFSKRHNSVNSVGGVMKLALLTLSDGV